MKKILILISVILFFLSCNQNNEPKEPIPPTSYPCYFPLTIGNYWIYERYDYNRDGVERKSTVLDSIVVVKDTIINSNKYYELHTYEYSQNNSYSRFKERKNLRDSADCVINIRGQIELSSINFKDTLEKFEYRDYWAGKDSVLLYSLSSKMEKPTEKNTVPAGSFDAIEYRATVIPNTLYSGLANPSYWHRYYAENIGLISHDMTFFSGGRYEYRLVRYHINEKQ